MQSKWKRNCVSFVSSCIEREQVDLEIENETKQGMIRNRGIWERTDETEWKIGQKKKEE